MANNVPLRGKNETVYIYYFHIYIVINGCNYMYNTEVYLLLIFIWLHRPCGKSHLLLYEDYLDSYIFFNLILLLWLVNVTETGVCIL